MDNLDIAKDIGKQIHGCIDCPECNESSAVVVVPKHENELVCSNCQLKVFIQVMKVW